MTASISDLVSNGFSLKFKQLLEIYDEVYHDNADVALELVKNIFNVDYDLPDDVLTLLFNLFGYTIPDLSFFSDEKKNIIKNLFADSILFFYKNRIRKENYEMIIYIYDITGQVYATDTGNWSEFYVRGDDYFDLNKYTDIGMITDNLYVTDNLHGTFFNQVIIKLDQEFDNDTLWYKDLGNAIKKNINNIRYVLSNILYTFECDVYGNYGSTEISTDINLTLDNLYTTDINFLPPSADNGVTYVSVTPIVNIADLKTYKVFYTDLTSETFEILETDEDESNFYIYLENVFLTDKYVEKVELYNLSGSITYSQILCPEIYIESGDTLKFNIIVKK